MLCKVSGDKKGFHHLLPTISPLHPGYNLVGSNTYQNVISNNEVQVKVQGRPFLATLTISNISGPALNRATRGDWDGYRPLHRRRRWRATQRSGWVNQQGEGAYAPIPTVPICQHSPRAFWRVLLIRTKAAVAWLRFPCYMLVIICSNYMLLRVNYMLLHVNWLLLHANYLILGDNHMQITC